MNAPRPWGVEQHCTNSLQITDAENKIVCERISKTDEATAGDLDVMAHIVDCVNACEGLEPEAIPALLEAAEDYVFSSYERPVHRKDIRAALRKVKGLA